MRLLAGREYSSGTRWCLWRWTDVVKDGEAYLTRLHLVQVPWFSVMLHWIRKGDHAPDMHDHPVAFVSFVLRGFYYEGTGGWGRRCIHRLRPNLKHAVDAHRIYYAAPGTLTLVFAGPVVRDWGYHTADGWVPWRDYQRGT